MKKLDVYLSTGQSKGTLVGQLAEAENKIYFEYDTDFLKSSLWLSPFKLPLEPGLKEHREHSFGPLFGLFDDSLPDGWGMLLMDRYFRQNGLPLEKVSPLDRLAYLGHRTMGALTYYPPVQADAFEAKILKLQELAAQSYEVLAGNSETVLPQLQRAGGSPGGARPKVLVGIKDNEIISGEEILPSGYESWLIKFYSSRESKDDGRIEYAYSNMASAAGVTMPATRLFHTENGEDFFGVSRFDRSNKKRFHIHTFGNMIHSNFRVPNCDYEILLKVTQVLTKNHIEVIKAFRVMVFNVLAHNRDDHVKNFAFMIDESGEWCCTPAYDLTFAHGPGGEHTMTIAGEGQAPKSVHFMKIARGANIKESEAKAIIDEVASSIAQWTRFAREAGVGRQHIRKIADIINKK